MIELKQVSKYYGERPAVENLSFCVEEGETFGLIGTSGCGKTTTLKMINRLEEPDSGHITVDGQSAAEQNAEELRRGIGYVIQDVGLFPHYTVTENIALVPKLRGWDQQRISLRCKELLELVGLNAGEFAHRKPAALSGGQQQRVGLARALAADPPIILMDEPFGALDPITKREVRAEVQRIFTEIKKTIVLVTHDVEEAFDMCDRLCLLNDGNLQQVGSPQELLFNPANEFVDSFFISNRFQLELLSIRLSEVIETESSSELYWSPPTNSDQTVDSQQSIYATIVQMESGQKERMLIHRINGQVKHSLGFSDLLSRFRQHRNKLKSEGFHG